MMTRTPTILLAVLLGTVHGQVVTETVTVTYIATPAPFTTTQTPWDSSEFSSESGGSFGSLLSSSGASGPGGSSVSSDSDPSGSFSWAGSDKSGSSGFYMRIWAWFALLLLCCCSIILIGGIAFMAKPQKSRKNRMIPPPPQDQEQAPLAAEPPMEMAYQEELPALAPLPTYSTPIPSYSQPAITTAYEYAQPQYTTAPAYEYAQPQYLAPSTVQMPMASPYTTSYPAPATLAPGNFANPGTFGQVPMMGGQFPSTTSYSTQQMAYGGSYMQPAGQPMSYTTGGVV